MKVRDMLADPAMLALFDEWWAIYPRRCGKGAARKAFMAVLAKEQVRFPDLVQKTVQFRESRINHPDHPKFTPHPSTWLHQERWEDELLPAPLPHQNGGAQAVRNAVNQALKRL